MKKHRNEGISSANLIPCRLFLLWGICLLLQLNLLWCKLPTEENGSAISPFCKMVYCQKKRGKTRLKHVSEKIIMPCISLLISPRHNRYVFFFDFQKRSSSYSPKYICYVPCTLCVSQYYWNLLVFKWQYL